MSEHKDVKLPFQVAINAQNTRVLFAQFDSDLVDVLISFLTLPLGKIVKLFQKHYGEGAPVIGSLTTLYNGLANLDDVCFCTKECKEMLLDPKSSFSNEFCGRLKLNIDDSPMKSFGCPKMCMTLTVNTFGNGYCSRCGSLMSKEVSMRTSHATTPSIHGVFSIKNTSFTVSDDLQVVSNASTFGLQNADKFGIKDANGMKLKTFEIGVDDAMELLKGLFVSQTPLTDLLRKKRQMHHLSTDKHNVTVSSSLNQNVAKAQKYVVKAVLQKSMNKLLFLQANYNFVDFIVSLLVIPLGAVAHLLGGNASIVCLDNLYRSIFSLDKDCHLMEKGAKDLLLKVQHGCVSARNILPLADRDPYMFWNNRQCVVKDPEGFIGCYISGPRKFIVADDLTVMPFTMVSFLSQLNKMNVPISDAEEVELQIGMHEALNILKGSLVSTTGLTDTLMPLLKKQPKQENVG